MTVIDYVQAGSCDEDCACSGSLSAQDCPLEPGCVKCAVRLQLVGPEGSTPPDSIVVVRVRPGESLRRTIERELGPDFARGPGSTGYVN